MSEKKVIVIKTDTYKKTLYKLRDANKILSVEKKIDKLVGNPNLAIPMGYQHSGICEIKVGSQIRVYGIKRERTIIAFLLGPAIKHKGNYKQSKEYKRLFAMLQRLEAQYGEDFIEELEKSLR